MQYTHPTSSYATPIFGPSKRQDTRLISTKEASIYTPLEVNDELQMYSPVVHFYSRVTDTNNVLSYILFREEILNFKLIENINLEQKLHRKRVDRPLHLLQYMIKLAV